MQLTTEERVYALDTLNSRGLGGDDSITSLDTICRKADDASLQSLLFRVRRSNDRGLAAEFGHDAVPAIRMLLAGPLKERVC